MHVHLCTCFNGFNEANFIVVLLNGVPGESELVARWTGEAVVGDAVAYNGGVDDFVRATPHVLVLAVQVHVVDVRVTFLKQTRQCVFDYQNVLDEHTFAIQLQTLAPPPDIWVQFTQLMLPSSRLYNSAIYMPILSYLSHHLDLVFPETRLSNNRSVCNKCAHCCGAHTFIISKQKKT
jgi:hypothetical protein